MFLVAGFILLLVSLAVSKVQHYELEVVNKYIQPDGFNRNTVLANGTFPGPLISAQKGDSLAIRVVNKLTEHSMLRSTSIHWHGIFQHKTAYADGSAFVSQCPITSGDSFLYNFGLGQQSGTFWYHSHLATQYCDGLRGPLVIYDPVDPHRSLYDVDNVNTVITLGDWYHLPAPEAFATVADSASTLINGLGRYAGGPNSPLAVVNVKHGLRYRLRVLNIACWSFFTFQIDQHQFNIIEADGQETQPLVVESLDIYAGQRYSVVLNANQPIGNYWIRANPSAGPAGFDHAINSAILRYLGAKNVDPTTTQKNGTVLLEQNLHPRVNSGPLGGGRKPDISLNFVVNFNATAVKLTMNGVAYEPPSVPVLLQVLSGAAKPGDLMPNGSIYTLPRNKLVEVSIPGFSPLGPHPFHLHGHSFEVVRSAGSSTYNYTHPVNRDVVNTGFLGDNVTFRFMTNNPGPWFLHCHIEWHLAAGLAVVFAEAPEDQIAGPNAQARPPAWEELCNKYNALPPNLQ